MGGKKLQKKKSVQPSSHNRVDVSLFYFENDCFMGMEKTGKKAGGGEKNIVKTAKKRDWLLG